jgi:mono/diheme cytochrome c family protein
VIRNSERLFLACAFAAVVSTAWAQGATQQSRGELLYSTHCIACHTQQIHWREQKLVTDWASLDGQVRRWARNAGLSWSDNDVAEVARYLNALHYRFAEPSVTGAEGGEIPRGLARAK